MRQSQSYRWLAEVKISPESDAEYLSAGELTLPATDSSLLAAREYVEETAAAFGFDADSCYQFVFAVNEAVTNAIKHGGSDEHGYIRLRAITEGDLLTFVVHDYGTFRVSSIDRSIRVEHGRGLAFMASLTDKIGVSAKPGGTTVSLSKARV
jgi:anti-sigma regulatory factor (Ser/Thr protein kinase)